MKIYDSTLAPNPKKLRVFLAEKNVAIPYEAVDLMTGGARSRGVAPIIGGVG